jgi:hypothetical protein
VTFFIQSATLPLTRSWMAMCVIAALGPLRCQCFTPAGIQTTSPFQISSTGPPHCRTRPVTSDRDRSKQLLDVPLATVIDIFKTVGHDEANTGSFHFDPKKGDFTYSLQK